jgi:hypothetical protein
MVGHFSMDKKYKLRAGFTTLLRAGIRVSHHVLVWPQYILTRAEIPGVARD